VVILLILLAITSRQAQFPVAPLGMCYDGIHTLSQIYAGHDIQYAYDAPNGADQGHVWLIVDGQPIDSYYGPVQGDYWTHPQFTYSSLPEIDAGITYQTGYYEDANGNWIKRCPVTGMSEEDQRA
jgi:hypothetical protein